MAINRSAAIIASVKMAEFIVQDVRNACSLQRIFPGQPAKNAQESVLANPSEIMENLLYKMIGGGGGEGREGGGGEGGRGDVKASNLSAHYDSRKISSSKCT